MRRHRVEPIDTDNADIDLTPMLDVVFIMLIFFVVTTSFVKESGIDVNRPTASSAQRQEKANLLIAIRPNGEIWFDGRAIDLRSVRANVERARAESPQSHVVIQGDRAAQIGLLVEVMDQVRLAGIQDVAIAAEQGGDE